MLKKLILIIVISFLVAGCSIKKISNYDIDKITNEILSQKNTLANRSANGYKYYLPKGIRLVDNNDYNEKLYNKGDIYYLYIDVVNYYYQKDWNFQVTDDAYFSKKLNYNKKQGYLEITKINDKYFVEMMYNYAKVETYVEEKNLFDSIINISYILSSIQYNDKTIPLLFDSNILNYNEEKFDIFEPKRKEGKFLDYVNEYDVYDEEKEAEGINTDQNIEE